MWVSRRRFVSMEAVVVLALASAPAVPRAHEAEQSEDCPAPSPRFRVGYTIRSLNVPGAFDPTTLTSNENRPVQVHLWYPARDHDECDEATDAEGGFGECHAPATVYASRLHGLHGDVLAKLDWSPLAWTIPARVAFEDVRIAEEPDRFPVIVFSHGNTNNAIDHAYLLEELASYGYIVAAPDHVNNTQDDVRIDFVNDALRAAHQPLIPCLDGAAPDPVQVGTAIRLQCSRPNVAKSMVDRYHDVEAVLDALPAWFGHRVDMERVGIMGHSRGTVTILTVAGGSVAWGLPPLRDQFGKLRFRALMGLAIGTAAITSNVDVKNVTVPAVLVGGTADHMSPLFVTTTAFSQLASADKHLVVIQNGVHRHFDSAYCAEMHGASAFAQVHPEAMLDRQTATQILVSPNSGLATDFCGVDSFTNPDITPFVKAITGFTVTSTPPNVPTSGLTTDTVREQVVGLAVPFFGRVLSRGDDDDRSSRDCLPGGGH